MERIGSVSDSGADADNLPTGFRQAMARISGRIRNARNLHSGTECALTDLVDTEASGEPIGDSRVCPKGWKGTSEVVETVRKVYMIISQERLEGDIRGRGNCSQGVYDY